MAQAGVGGDPSMNASLHTHEAQGGADIGRAAVLGFTLAFCFLPSALCLMAFPILMYVHRSVR